MTPSVARTSLALRLAAPRVRWAVLGGAMAVMVAASLLLGQVGTGHPHAGQSVVPAPGLVGVWLATITMWQAMMVAMMAPVVLPWLGLVAVTHAEPGRAALPVVAGFAMGYFAVWLAYSVLAGTLQVGLQHAGLLDGASRLPRQASGVLVIAAGLFQFTPWKHACLRHCRSPLSYLLGRWHGAPPSPFRLGAGHGWYCVGCCWALMAVAFGVGLMSLTWMAAVTLGAAVEQVVPRGTLIARVTGILLLGWGSRLIVLA
jgi:predicted metal-binding membrane protein